MKFHIGQIEAQSYKGKMKVSKGDPIQIIILLKINCLRLREIYFTKTLPLPP